MERTKAPPRLVASLEGLVGSPEAREVQSALPKTGIPKTAIAFELGGSGRQDRRV